MLYKLFTGSLQALYRLKGTFFPRIFSLSLLSKPFGGVMSLLLRPACGNPVQILGYQVAVTGISQSLVSYFFSRLKKRLRGFHVRDPSAVLGRYQ